MGGVEVDDLDDEGADVVRIRTTEPTDSTGGSGKGNVLGVVEDDVTVDVGVGGAVKGTEGDEVWGTVFTVGREELVEKGSGAVEEDGFWTEEEVWVCGDGVLIAIVLMLGDDGLIERIAVDDIGLEAAFVGEFGELGKVGFVEGVIVTEEEIGASEGSIPFEFLTDVNM